MEVLINPLVFRFSKQKLVRNEAKGQISKRMFQENKARQIFRKTNIFYPLIRTRTCAYEEEMFVFRKI